MKKTKFLSVSMVLLIIISSFSNLAFSSKAVIKAESKLEEIVDFRNDWTYKINITENEIPDGGFDDSSWMLGKLPIGNGGGSSPGVMPFINGAGGTSLATYQGNTPNLVLQKSINVSNLEEYAGFVMDAFIDDGAVLLVNGEEAARFNAVKSIGRGTSDIYVANYRRNFVINDPTSQTAKSEYKKFFIDKNLFAEGDNVITILVLQDSRTSGDILFDGMLYTVSKDYEDLDTPKGTGINRGAQWLWTKNSVSNMWLSDNFIPMNWNKHNAPIGYGAIVNTSVVPHNTEAGDPSHPTANVYLRRILTIDDISQIKSVKLNISVDDSAEIYFNGVKVHTSNEGGSVGTEPYEESVYVSSENLRNGDNVISINLINVSATSSDLYFDMDMELSYNELPFMGTKFIMTPGKTSSEIGFTWYSPYNLDENNIYVVPNTADENKYAVQLGGAINGAGARFHDGNAKSIYKLPLNKDMDSAILYIDISQNYTIELSADGATWNDEFPLYADPELAGKAGVSAGNRHKAEFDLSKYMERGADYVYIRIGDQTTDSGWGGILFNIYLRMGAESILSGAAVQIAKADEMINDEFPDSDNTFTGTMIAADGSYQSNKVTVTGLEENTEYVYRFGNQDKDDWSEVYPLSIKAKDEYKAIFVGDPQIGGGNVVTDGQGWNKNLNAAVQKIPDASFILSAGDQSDKELESEYEALTKAEQIKKIPFAPANGNHDGTNPSFSYHYNTPNVTGLGKTGGGSDYYFSYGNTLYIILNSNNENVLEHKQAMNAAIASHPDAAWRIVMMHFDVYGSGYHAVRETINDAMGTTRLRQNLTPVFDELNIDLVLNGHDHTYTRSYFMEGLTAKKKQVFDKNGAVINPIGIMYISGTCSSGSKFYELVGNPSWAEVKHDIRVPQFSELAVSDNEFRITTYRSDNLAVVDSITLKRAATKEDVEDLLTKAEAKEEEIYTKESYGRLKNAIESTKTVVGLANASDEQMNEVYAELSDAIEALKLKSEYKNELNDKIKDAENLLKSAIIGSENGQYPQSAKDELESAITVAMTVLNDVEASENAVDSQTLVLSEAIGKFKSQMNSFNNVEKDNSDSNIGKSPETGDNNVIIHMVIMCLGLIASVGLLVKNRKIKG